MQTFILLKLKFSKKICERAISYNISRLYTDVSVCVHSFGNVYNKSFLFNFMKYNLLLCFKENKKLVM